MKLPLALFQFAARSGMVLALGTVAMSAPGPVERFEDFATDPHWESFRSRLLPNPLPLIRQDFGWRNASPADPNRLAIGGWIQRSITPAWFARVIPKRTLRERLSASGRLLVKRDDGGSGALFGWFHDTSRGWRTPNSVAFRVDGNGGGYWVFYEYGTRHWLTGGGGCFEGDRYQTTPTKPFRPDGTPHEWTLDYDPEGAGGRGLMTFVLDGKTYTQALAPGHKDDGAEFNRFGFFNQQSTGGGMEVYVDRLTFDGKAVESNDSPHWEARGNQVEFRDRQLRPFHDFGWTSTHQAGRGPGEVGGIIWRDEKPAYFARPVGSLTLDDELSASGWIAFNAAGSDSGVFLGWFNSGSKTNKVISDHLEPQTNFLAILLEGPSQVGHYFRAAYSTAKGQTVVQDAGPIFRPDGRPRPWSIRYSPRTGQIVVTLADETCQLMIPAEHRKHGAAFDRFGLFNLQVGGHFVSVAVDDLRFTTRLP